MKVLGKAKSITAVFQGPDGLLEGFLVSFSDAHDLTNGTHLCSEFVLGIRKLLEGPAREFDHHVVAIWRVLIKGTLPPVRNLVQGDAGRQH